MIQGVAELCTEVSEYQELLPAQPSSAGEDLPLSSFTVSLLLSAQWLQQMAPDLPRMTAWRLTMWLKVSVPYYVSPLPPSTLLRNNY